MRLVKLSWVTAPPAPRWSNEKIFRCILGILQVQPREPLASEEFPLGLEFGRPLERANVIVRLGGKPVASAGQC